MDNTIDLEVISREKCVMEEIMIYFKDYFSEKPFVYNKASEKYSVLRDVDFKQIAWELIIKNVPSVVKSKLYASTIMVKTDEIQSCYTSTELFQSSLTNNLLTLGLNFNLATYCAVDQPKITATFIKETYYYKKVMTPMENTNPLKGATYEVFFPGKYFKGMNDEITFKFEVESYSPSGNFIKK